MSLLDVFRKDNIKGKVIDKYSLKNGNIGVIVEDEDTHRRYAVEFKDGYQGPSLENLFGIIREPFAGRTEHLDRLIGEDDTIELGVSYSRGPFRQAYRIRSVLGAGTYDKREKTMGFPYRAAHVHQY